MGWGGRASKRGCGGGERSDTTTSGCMCAVFQFFDFHQFQFPNLQNQQHSLRPEDLTIPKGVEAPRNSLDSSEETETSLSSITKEEDNLNIHILKIQQIRTSGGRVSDRSTSNSPGTKTPSLVARLMGLDLLPESHSPSSTSSLTPNPHSISKPHLNPHPLRPSRQPLQNINAPGTRSLPETPRISSARRSDVDHHRRLSLQINKENIAVGEELEFSRLSSAKRKELLKSIIKDHESGKSPSHYARQIVKQVKETVSKKVGLVDITNSPRNDRDLLLLLKSKKVDANPGKLSQPSSCSPRLRVSEASRTIKLSSTTNSTTTSTTFKDQIQVLPPKPNNAKVQAKPKLEPTSIQKRRKIVDDGFSPAKMKKQEEAFVRPSTAPTRAQQQCKKTHLISNNLLNLNNVPTLLPIKKDPSPPATKLPQKQLFSSTSQLLHSHQYKQDQATSSSTSSIVLASRAGKNDDVIIPNDLAAARDRATGGAAAGISADMRQYVTRILCRTAIDKDTQVSFTNWFSPSHPLDPSIFYHLENTFTASNNHPSQLGLRCNRKLVFHVVDEILVEILRPYLNLKPWVCPTTHVTKFGHKGSRLVDIVCYKIQSFPGADCRVLEDIDDLIDEDLPESKVQSVTASAFEEEGEGVVREIEKDLLDTLVHETAMSLRF